MRNFVIVLCALVLMSTAAVVARAQPFVGTWEWAGTVYALGGSESPSTTGHTRQMMFAADHQFILYQDGQPVHVGIWDIGDIWVPPHSISQLWTSDGSSWLNFQVSDDSTPILVLSNWSTMPPSILGPDSRTEYYSLRSVVADQTTTWGSTKVMFR